MADITDAEKKCVSEATRAIDTLRKAAGLGSWSVNSPESIQASSRFIGELGLRVYDNCLEGHGLNNVVTAKPARER